ncbi:hypothetical protein [Vibrio cholerae]|uniref:hypothetical protein n=1 Tax=Vibrio cholerae TaxID=666 RepID=UPI001C672C1D|nr:hypothetical protein [Vibrio cholerae]
MGDEIKVGNVFNLPVKVTPPVTETKGGWPIVSASLVGNSISGQIATLTISKGQHSGASKYLDVDLAFKMAQASALAINNHDRLVDENQQLRWALEKALSVVNRAAAMEDSDAKIVSRGVQKLLSELGGE